MPEVTCTGREACHVCGSDQWKEAVFTAGRLICRPCHKEILRNQREAAQQRRLMKPGEVRNG